MVRVFICCKSRCVLWAYTSKAQYIMNIESQYLDLVKTVLQNGIYTDERTGTGTIAIPHAMISHDMSNGFPIMTTKKIAWKTLKVELEGFIKGVTDKTWFKDRGCRIWDEWCNPMLVPSWLESEERKEFQLQERRLGPIYGYQWRQFGNSKTVRGVDQLQRVLDTLIKNPNDRRMLVSAWNPQDLDQMALPPCHYAWQVSVIGGKLHLCWNQRSCDLGLGIPYNIASYALLLMLLAKHAGLEPGTLTGFLTNVHIYKNHVEPLKLQLTRTPFDFPTLKLTNVDFLSWDHTKASLVGYRHCPVIPMAVAV